MNVRRDERGYCTCFTGLSTRTLSIDCGRVNASAVRTETYGATAKGTTFASNSLAMRYQSQPAVNSFW